MILRILERGATPRCQLGSLIGRLPFSQTSLFGRFGRATMSPLRTRLNAQVYHPMISGVDKRVLQWWAASLRNLGDRKVRDRPDRPDWAANAGAEAKTAIISAATSHREDFKANEPARELISPNAGNYWDNLSDSADKIYGLAMSALISKLCHPNDDIRSCDETFHIDNANAAAAVVKNTATPTVIVAMGHLIRRGIRDIGITEWFEWGHGPKNVAGIPTREETPF